jgi:transcriptional regulator with XRE-family HTH domain
MESRGISLEQLCERSELSRSQIERVMAADSEPTARDLLRLASAVDGSVSELLAPPRDE